MKKVIISAVVILSLGVISEVRGVTSVEIKVNGLPAEVMTQSDSWSVEWDLARVGSISALFLYVDVNKNKAYDDGDRSIIPEGFMITDGVWDDDDLGDSDRERNGRVKFSLGIYSLWLPPTQCLMVVEEEDGSRASDWIDVNPAPEYFSISGSISPAQANIVVGADNEMQQRVYSFGITNADGQYQINLPVTSSEFSYEVGPLTELSGYYPLDDTQDVSVGPNNSEVTGIDFVYQPIVNPGEIKGRVYLQGGTPSSFIIIVYAYVFEGGTRRTFSTKIRTDGSYSLKVPENEYNVYISPEYHYYVEEEFTEPVIVSGGQVRDGINFKLNPLNSRVYGRVTDAATGQPFEGISISLYREIRPNEWRLTGIYGTTDANGRYSIQVCDGRWKFECEDLPPGYKAPDIEPFTIGDNEEKEINIALVEEVLSSTIKGKVTDDQGQPVANIEIEAEEFFEEDPGAEPPRTFTTRTDSQGNYKISLPNGTYVVWASGRGEYIVEDNAQEVEVYNETKIVNFTLNPLNSRIYGRVIDKETRAPIENIHLSLRKKGEYSSSQGGRTNSNGEYSIRVCDGRWEFEWYSLPSEYKIPSLEVVTIGDNEEKEVNIELEKYVLESVVKGRVVDDQGNPWAGIKVEVVKREDWPRIPRAYEGVTDNEGYYQIPVPNGGPYQVAIRIRWEERNLLNENIIIPPYYKGITLNKEEIELNFKLNPCNSKISGKITPRRALTPETKVRALTKIAGEENGEGRRELDFWEFRRRSYIRIHNETGLWVGYAWRVSQDGKYTLALPDGEWKLEVINLARGYQATPVTITLGEAETKEYNFNLIGSIDSAQALALKGLTYPNPCHSMVQVSVAGTQGSAAELRIYNILGQLVRRISLSQQPTSTSGVFWDGCNSKGQKVPAGIYYYQLHNSKRVMARKMSLLK